MYALQTEPGQLQRLGIIMEPDLADPREAGGVLNPAATRGPDGALYLLPRLVGAGNYSRIGLARVVHDRQGDPRGVERLGVVLEPEEPYERNSRTGGGVEDPRVTYLAALETYVMTYTAYGKAGPRIALAISHDLVHWRRRGPVQFAPHHGFDLGVVENKDAMLFPEPVPAPDRRPALALIHRPDLRLRRPDGVRVLAPVPGLCEKRPSMWLSYAPLDELAADRRPVFGQHHLLAGPAQPWERLKVGGRHAAAAGGGRVAAALPRCHGPDCGGARSAAWGPLPRRLAAARWAGSAPHPLPQCTEHPGARRGDRAPGRGARGWCFRRGWTPGLMARWTSTMAWPTPASG